jgi:hypothetical protein
VRNAIVAGLFSLLFGAGIASAQTAVTPASSSPPAAEPGRFSISAEALLWWFKNSPAPVPLVTDGLLGEPGTKTFLGGEDLDTGANPGFRLTAGYAFTERWGVEGSYFYIPSRSTSRSVSSSGQLGSTDLIVPFIDATTGSESGTEISFAPIYRGSATETLSNNLMGADLNATWALSPSGPWRVDLLGGFRWLRLHETYTFTSSSPFIPPFPRTSGTPPTSSAPSITSTAPRPACGRASTGRASSPAPPSSSPWAPWRSPRASAAPSSPTTTPTSAPPRPSRAATSPCPPTSANYSRTVFAVVPEIGLNLGYQITSWASVFVGYTFLYTNNVIRPGNQINRAVNTSQSTAYTQDPAAQLQGAAQPTFKFKSSDFWAQGMNLGLAFRF